MSKTAANPFFGNDFTKYMDVSKMMDFSKMKDFTKCMDISKMMDMPKAFQDFKMPGLDMEAFMSTQRKNMQALASANQMAVEGMQAMMRRQSEIMRQGMEESSQMLNGVIASPTPGEKVTKQAEMTKCVFDRALGNAKELAEMLTKANYEAMEVISSRVGESLEELRGMMKNGKAHGKE